jgi:hypothetical protein
MRLGFYTCVLAGCIGGILLGVLDIILNKGKNLLGVAAIVGGLLAPAFYGKQAQAKSESSELSNFNKDKSGEDR